MAKCLCIKAATHRPGVNEIGDIVSIMEDSHEFGPAEIDGFDVITLNGTVAKVEAAMYAKHPSDPNESASYKHEYKVVDFISKDPAVATNCKVKV